MMKNLTAILACLVGTALAALLPENSSAQVANGRATTAAPVYVNNTTAPLSLDLAGNLRVALDAVNDAIQVVGNVASGAADSGNPVKVGGIFQTTPSTVTNGQRSNIQVDANGNLRSNQVSGTVTGADNVANTAINGTLPPASSTAATQLNPTANFVFDGAAWDRMPGTSAGGVSTTVVAALPAGNNNIGDVDVATIAAGNNNIGDVDIASIAAGNNNIGDVDIASMTPVATTSATALVANTATVLLASPATLRAITWANITTAVQVQIFDSASACSGTVRVAIRVLNEGSLAFPTPIAFSNGMTACTNAGTAGLGYIYN